MSERLRTPTLFADTSDIKEIKQLMELGIFDGITTNPIIVAEQAGKNEPAKQYQKIIDEFPDYPVSIQLLDNDVPTLIQQGKDYAAISPNVVIKVPMFGNGKGLTVIRGLMDEGININVTAMMSAEQALLATMAGRTEDKNGPAYLSLFFNRIKDGGGNPMVEIEETRRLIDNYNLDSRIIAGSIRKPSDVYDAIIAGTHIVTVPPKIVWEMIKDQQSEKFIDQAQSAWEKLTSKAE